MADRAGPHVVVVGGGVAGLSAALTAVTDGARVTLVEAADRLGGKIRTERVDGFVVEAGPDTLVTGKPTVRALLAALDLGEELVEPRAASRPAVLRRGRLVPLPDGLAVMVPQRLRPILVSGLLSVGGRARAALEIVVPRRRADGDESVESFVTRRLGRQAYERLAEPLIGGIHAGDVGSLGIRETFPHLQQDESRHGSLARAVPRRRWDAWRRGPSRTPSSPTPDRAPAQRPVPMLAAPRSGMHDLIRALSDAVVDRGGQVLVGGEVLSVGAAPADTSTGASTDRAPGRRRYRVATSRGLIEADAVVLAVPAAAAARLCGSLDGDLAGRLAEFPTASVTSVYLVPRLRRR